MYGAEYVQAIMSQPRSIAPKRAAETILSAILPAVPAQHEIERDLAHYEHYVANRESVFADLLQERGGQR